MARNGTKWRGSENLRPAKSAIWPPDPNSRRTRAAEIGGDPTDRLVVFLQGHGLGSIRRTAGRLQIPPNTQPVTTRKSQNSEPGMSRTARSPLYVTTCA